MPCCGNTRPPQVNPTTRPALTPSVFQYTGRTKLTAIGAVTRRLYYFDRPQARALVDSRDIPSLASVPNLRRV